MLSFGSISGKNDTTCWNLAKFEHSSYRAHEHPRRSTPECETWSGKSQDPLQGRAVGTTIRRVRIATKAWAHETTRKSFPLASYMSRRNTIQICCYASQNILLSKGPTKFTLWPFDNAMTTKIGDLLLFNEISCTTWIRNYMVRNNTSRSMQYNVGIDAASAEKESIPFLQKIQYLELCHTLFYSTVIMWNGTLEIVSQISLPDAFFTRELYISVFATINQSSSSSRIVKLPRPRR